MDTHIHRLAKRWGLTLGGTVEQTEADLKAVFPEAAWNRVHLQVRRACTNGLEMRMEINVLTCMEDGESHAFTELVPGCRADRVLWPRALRGAAARPQQMPYLQLGRRRGDE